MYGQRCAKGRFIDVGVLEKMWVWGHLSVSLCVYLCVSILYASLCTCKGGRGTTGKSVCVSVFCLSVYTDVERGSFGVE